MPPKADSEAQTIVEWNVIFDTTVTLVNVKRPIVTGIGIILDEELTRLLFADDDPELPPLLLVTQYPFSTTSVG